MRAAVGPVSPPAAQHHLDAAPASVTGHCRVTGAGGAPLPPPRSFAGTDRANNTNFYRARLGETISPTGWSHFSARRRVSRRSFLTFILLWLTPGRRGRRLVWNCISGHLVYINPIITISSSILVSVNITLMFVVRSLCQFSTFHRVNKHWLLQVHGPIS